MEMAFNDNQQKHHLLIPKALEYQCLNAPGILHDSNNIKDALHLQYPR